MSTTPQPIALAPAAPLRDQELLTAPAGGGPAVVEVVPVCADPAAVAPAVRSPAPPPEAAEIGRRVNALVYEQAGGPSLAGACDLVAQALGLPVATVVACYEQDAAARNAANSFYEA